MLDPVARYVRREQTCGAVVPATLGDRFEGGRFGELILLDFT